MQQSTTTSTTTILLSTGTGRRRLVLLRETGQTRRLGGSPAPTKKRPRGSRGRRHDAKPRPDGCARQPWCGARCEPADRDAEGNKRQRLPATPASAHRTPASAHRTRRSRGKGLAGGSRPPVTSMPGKRIGSNAGVGVGTTRRSTKKDASARSSEEEEEAAQTQRRGGTPRSREAISSATGPRCPNRKQGSWMRWLR